MCRELNITKAINADGKGHWIEPMHQDGGASVLHMGLTLFGRRNLVCTQGSGQPDVLLENRPGLVYLGQLTGPRHQVLHQPAPDDELLDIPGVGKCSVTVMFRTGLFPHCRSRLRNTTPSPVKVFRKLAESFRVSVASGLWRLPTLTECHAAFAELAAGAQCSGGAGTEMEPAPESRATAKKGKKRFLRRSSAKAGAKRRR